MAEKTEIKVIIHHEGVLSKKQLQAYIREAVAGWKNGLHPEDVRRSIKKVTFKLPPLPIKRRVDLDWRVP